MRRCMLILVLAGSTAAAVLPATAAAQDPQAPAASVPSGFTRFTPDQLRDLVAPIALYADPLLAQVLLAATFPDQIAAAAAYVQSNGTNGIDDQYWDVSVKAVAHYPTVLNLLNTRIDWTTSLGQAYAAQSGDVMAAVQDMRRMARSQGNLENTPEQEVVADADYIRIWPAQPQVIYVPVYDPTAIFYRPIFVRPGFRAFFSFGVPFAIGPWLIYDWDWPGHRIYYTGWYGGGWIGRSRPFISITNVYVNPMHRRVWYDRDVLRRHVDYGRAFPYQNRGRDGRGDGYRDDGPRYTGRNAQPRDERGTAGARDGQRRNAAPGTGLGPTQPTVQTAPAREGQRSRWSGGSSARDQGAPPTPWNAGSELTTASTSEARSAHQRSWSGTDSARGDLPRTQYGGSQGLPRTEYGTPSGLPRTEYGTPRSLPRTEYGEPRSLPRTEYGSPRQSTREAPRSFGGGQSAPRERGSAQAPRSEGPRQDSGNRNSGDQGGRGAHRR